MKIRQKFNIGLKKKFWGQVDLEPWHYGNTRTEIEWSVRCLLLLRIPNKLLIRINHIPSSFWPFFPFFFSFHGNIAMSALLNNGKRLDLLLVQYLFLLFAFGCHELFFFFFWEVAFDWKSSPLCKLCLQRCWKQFPPKILLVKQKLKTNPSSCVILPQKLYLCSYLF